MGINCTNNESYLKLALKLFHSFKMDCSIWLSNWQILSWNKIKYYYGMISWDKMTKHWLLSEYLALEHMMCNKFTKNFKYIFSLLKISRFFLFGFPFLVFFFPNESFINFHYLLNGPSSTYFFFYTPFQYISPLSVHYTVYKLYFWFLKNIFIFKLVLSKLFFFTKWSLYIHMCT